MCSTDVESGAIARLLWDTSIEGKVEIINEYEENVEHVPFVVNTESASLEITNCMREKKLTHST